MGSPGQMVQLIEVNGQMITRQQWKALQQSCPHERWAYPGVQLMDGSPMAICERCKFIQHEPIARIIEEAAA